MTSPAIKLARECGIRVHKHSDDDYHTISTTLLVKFHAKAQAQALRDAADEFDNHREADGRSIQFANALRRMAEELEKCS